VRGCGFARLLLDVVRSVLRRVKERVRVSVATGPGRGSRLQLAVAVLFVMLVGVFSVVLSLLIIAGDVELNPGPPKGKALLYFEVSIKKAANTRYMGESIEEYTVISTSSILLLSCYLELSSPSHIFMLY